MTRQPSFKRLVRARMAKTGESYTAARAVLLAGDPAPTRSRTIDVPPERVFDALGPWLVDAPMILRTASRPRSARFDWAADGSRVAVIIDAKDGGTRCTLSVAHSRLVAAASYAHRKTWWRERLVVLKAQLEDGADDA